MIDSTDPTYERDFGGRREIRPADNTQMEDSKRLGGLFKDANGDFYSPAAERAYGLLHPEE